MKLKLLSIALIAGITFTSCNDNRRESNQEKIYEDSLQANNALDSAKENERLTKKKKAEQDKEDAELVERVKDYIIEEYLSEEDLRTIEQDDRKFQFRQIDLNNDGEKEILINFITPYFCGTGGCSLVLLNQEMEVITKFTVTRTPIYAETSVENEWRVLKVRSEGEWRKLVYTDGSYPTNPSVAEIASEEPSQDATILFKKDVQVIKTHLF